jgi:Trk K+ transport system NAD-binding subunit
VDIIAELRHSDIFNRLPVTIIDDTIDANPVGDSRTSFVRGNPSEVKVLEQANVREARYAIVLARNQTAVADQQTVLTVLAIEDLNPEVHTCAELNDAGNEGHLRRAGCDAIVNTNLLTSKLLALSLQNPVANKVLTELASFHGSEIYRVQMSQGVEGSRFDDLLAVYKKERDAIVIGIERSGETLINPSGDFEVKVGDYLLVISEHAPVFNTDAGK